MGARQEGAADLVEIRVDIGRRRVADLDCHLEKRDRGRCEREMPSGIVRLRSFNDRAAYVNRQPFGAACDRSGLLDPRRVGERDHEGVTRLAVRHREISRCRPVRSDFAGKTESARAPITRGQERRRADLVQIGVDLRCRVAQARRMREGDELNARGIKMEMPRAVVGSRGTHDPAGNMHLVGDLSVEDGLRDLQLVSIRDRNDEIIRRSASVRRTHSEVSRLRGCSVIERHQAKTYEQSQYCT